MTWGGNGVPVYEKLVEPGSSNGLFVGEGPGPPGPTRHDVPRVVAWCLTIAAVLSTAAVACQMAQFSGIKITSRILQFSFLALYPAALVVAAVVALSLSEGRSGAGVPVRRSTRWAEVALAACAVAVLVASAYTIAGLLTGARVGAEEFDQASWASRIAFAGWSIACVILGGLALYVIARGRRATTSTVDDEDNVAADSAEQTIEVPRRRLLDPVVACVLVGTGVLVFYVATSAFPKSSFPQTGGLGSGPGPSVGSRISSVSSNFSSLPIAFAALAVVVLVAARGRRHSRDGFSEVAASIAAIVGLLAVLTAGYGVWHAATADAIGGTLEWWGRASAITTALASGTLGAAAGYAKAQRPLAAPAEPEPIRTRFDPWLVALCLANAALGTAVLIAITAVEDEPRVAIGELFLQFGPFILLSVGLALAAAIVLAFSVGESTDATRHRTVRNAVDAITAIVSVATIVASGLVIVYVVGHKDSNGVPTVEQPIISALDSATAAAKLGYVTLALASGLLATGVLRLVWGGRHPSADDEPDAPDDEVPVVDLLP